MLRQNLLGSLLGLVLVSVVAGLPLEAEEPVSLNVPGSGAFPTGIGNKLTRGFCAAGHPTYRCRWSLHRQTASFVCRLRGRIFGVPDQYMVVLLAEH